MILSIEKRCSLSLNKTLLYEVSGLRRQGVWQYKRQCIKLEIQTANFINLVTKLRKDHKRMGSRSLYYLAQQKSLEIGMGINKFERTMSALGLLIKQNRKRIVTTIPAKHTYPNKIEGLILTGINKVVVGDITYYKTRGKNYYIFTLKSI